MQRELCWMIAALMLIHAPVSSGAESDSGTAMLQVTKWVTDKKQTVNGQDKQTRMYQWVESNLVVRQCVEYQFGRIDPLFAPKMQEVTNRLLSQRCDFLDLKDGHWVIAEGAARSYEEFLRRYLPSWEK